MQLHCQALTWEAQGLVPGSRFPFLCVRVAGASCCPTPLIRRAYAMIPYLSTEILLSFTYPSHLLQVKYLSISRSLIFCSRSSRPTDIRIGRSRCHPSFSGLPRQAPLEANPGPLCRRGGEGLAETGQAPLAEQEQGPFAEQASGSSSGSTGHCLRVFTGTLGEQSPAFELLSGRS